MSGKLLKPCLLHKLVERKYESIGGFLGAFQTSKKPKVSFGSAQRVSCHHRDQGRGNRARARERLLQGWQESQPSSLFTVGEAGLLDYHWQV